MHAARRSAAPHPRNPPLCGLAPTHPVYPFAAALGRVRWGEAAGHPREPPPPRGRPRQSASQQTVAATAEATQSQSAAAAIAALPLPPRCAAAADPVSRQLELMPSTVDTLCLHGCPLAYLF
jgi:hypothetical protein